MRAFVFTDPALASEAGRFVWLEIDSEKARNAAVRKKLRIQALPTFYVLDPADESVMLKWVGSASVAQMKSLLAEAHDRRGPASSAADTTLARADRLYGEGASGAAADAYRAALAAAPAGWRSHGRAVESLLFALYDTGDHAGAVRVAAEALPRLRATPSALNVAASGLSAALALDRADTSRAAAVSRFEAATREVLADPRLEIAGDDRSGGMIAILEARQDAGDSLGARRAAEEWAALLEAEAARAASPEQRTVFDSHRVSAYLELDRPERAIPMLEASERDFPDDYNPPARLAVVYQAMKRWDDALAASDRALARAYGPRRLRILQNRADLLVARGDAAGARKTLEGALAEAEALPDGQRSETTIASLRKKIQALSTAGHGTPAD